MWCNASMIEAATYMGRGSQPHWIYRWRLVHVGAENVAYPLRRSLRAVDERVQAPSKCSNFRVERPLAAHHVHAMVAIQPRTLTCGRNHLARDGNSFTRVAQHHTVSHVLEDIR